MTSLTLLLSLPSIKGFHEEYSASEASSSLNNKQNSLLEASIEKVYLLDNFENFLISALYFVHLKLVTKGRKSVNLSVTV